MAAGEIGFETDTGKFKIGDGATAWSSLAYATDLSRLPVTVVTARAVGTGGSAARLPVFRIDDFGADPTGATKSDAAFTACYAAALASIQSPSSGPLANATAGAIIELGAGFYQFSVNVFQIDHYAIGVRGQGKRVTWVYTSGSGGDCMYFTDTTKAQASSAPVTGFSAWGWGAGANVNGFHFGDRSQSNIDDVEVVGFAATGSVCALFRNDQGTAAGCEGTTCRMHVSQGGVANVIFDGGTAIGGAGPSFDYGDWFFHGVATTDGQNSAWIKFQNGAQFSGGKLAVVGNMSQNTANSAAVMTVGSSTSDTSQINTSDIHLAVEIDQGTVTDFFLEGASYNAGIIQCHGQVSIPSAGGTVAAGSTSGNVVLTISGLLNAPFFPHAASTGSSYSLLNTAFATFELGSSPHVSVNSATGGITPGQAGGIGKPIFSGSGAPSNTNPISSPAAGSFYFRTDTPTTANQRVYICSAGGATPTWIALV